MSIPPALVPDTSFQKKLAAIAQALAFIVQPQAAGEDARENMGKILDPAGRPICVHWNQHEHRLVFNGDWPSSDKGEGGFAVFRPRQSISISVAFDRPTRLIAKDVLRRFYAAFVRAYDEAVQQKQRHEEYAANKEATLCRAAELLGYRRTDHDRSSFSIYGGSGKVYVRVEGYDDTGIKLELHGSIARLAPALQALHKAMEEEQRDIEPQAASGSHSIPKPELKSA